METQTVLPAPARVIALVVAVVVGGLLGLRSIASGLSWASGQESSVAVPRLTGFLVLGVVALVMGVVLFVPRRVTAGIVLGAVVLVLVGWVAFTDLPFLAAEQV